MQAGAMAASCSMLRLPRSRALPLRSAAGLRASPMRPQQQPRPQRRSAAVQPCASAAAAMRSEPSGGGALPQVRMAAAVASLWQQMVGTFGAALQRVADATQQADIQKAVAAHLGKSFKAGRMLMSVAPFAVATSSAGSANTLILVTRAVGSFIKLYLLLLFLRVLLSWFPKFTWDVQPWLALRQVTDPYLNLFRGLVPPLLGTIDFTPLFGFLILQFLAGALDIGEDDFW